MKESEIKELLRLLNTKLQEQHLVIAESVIGEYKNVYNAISNKVKTINKPLKFIFLGEATTSFKNYFYNPSSDTTSFLNPNHFDQSNKEDLISKFDENEILVYDLYPLPLATFIYDSVSFKGLGDGYQELLNKHFELIKPLVDKDTKIILRYIKLAKRIEWKYFKAYFKLANFENWDIEKKENGKIIRTNVPVNISNNISANPDKIKILFKDLC